MTHKLHGLRRQHEDFWQASHKNHATMTTQHAIGQPYSLKSGEANALYCECLPS